MKSPIDTSHPRWPSVLPPEPAEEAAASVHWRRRGLLGRLVKQERPAGAGRRGVRQRRAA
jgi:hypothetical protein